MRRALAILVAVMMTVGTIGYVGYLTYGLVERISQITIVIPQ